MDAKLTYAIKFVADMDVAVAFYRDTLGLALGFQSPHWTEFATGETKLALHPASDANPPGSCQLGLGITGLDDAYVRREELGLTFTAPPTERFGTKIGRIRDSEGAEVSVSG
ncbi:MAG: VOC family protein [Sphingomonadaceae bacterium]|nr:VOC family protein [Sphingomonadaceae bacterium]